jgi:hypothetical protein
MEENNYRKGDLVEVRICKGLSGAYWSLCGVITDIDISFSRGRWVNTPWERIPGHAYTVQFCGARYDEAKAVDRDMCAAMVLHEQMLKPCAAPVDVGARIKSYLGETLAEARPLKTDAQVVDDTELIADLIMRIVHGRSRTDPSKLYRDSEDPRCKSAWATACQIQEEVFQTDVENALAEQG